MTGHGRARRCAALAWLGAQMAGQWARAEAPPLREQFRVTAREAQALGADEHAPGCNILVDPDGGERGLSIPSLWPGGVLPYAFDGNTTGSMQAAARAAMDEIEAVSPVRFVARTTEYDYLVVRNSTGNSAWVGKRGGPQDVNIVSWSWRFIIVHELMHSMGVWHEQQRSDRDPYVLINWANIQPGREHNFTVQPGLNHGAYDLESVMHYGQCAFSVCACSAACRTITAQPGFEALQTVMGQRTRMSDGDIATINALYDGRAVENLTALTFHGTLTDALDAAAPGDALLSEPSQFLRRPDYDLAGKGLAILSTEGVATASGSTFVLADQALLEAASGWGVVAGGDLVFPPGAAATVSGSSVAVLDAARVAASGGAGATLLAGAGVDVHGAVEASGAASVIIDGASVTLHPASVVDASSDALVALTAGAPIGIDGAVRLADGGVLSTGGSIEASASSMLRFGAPTGAIFAPQATIDGMLEVEAAGAGVVQASQIAGAGSIIVGEGGVLTLDTDALAWTGDGTILLGAGATLRAPSTRAAIAIDGLHMTLGPGARVEAGSPLAIGGAGQPAAFVDRAVSGAELAPRTTALGDLDGDGRLDIVVASVGSDRIVWHRRDDAWASGFAPAQVVDASAGGPAALAIGDINGDGLPDIVAAASADGAVRWYEHDGAPTPGFTRRTVATGVAGASGVAIADLDGDGDMDIISSAQGAGAVAWHEQIADGSFATHPIDNALAGASAVAVCDLDGDGDLDVVAAGQSLGEVVWQERAAGAPPSFTRRTILSSGGGAIALRVADMNEDGALDIVVAEASAGRVTLLRSDGAPTPSFTDQVVALTPAPVALEVADVDGDGRPDVVVGSLLGAGATWHANNGAPAPFFAPGAVRALADAVSSVAAGDVDGDGDMDVVLTLISANSTLWAEQRARATRLDAGASIASAALIEHHRLLDLAGGRVEAPALRLAPAGRLRGAGEITGDLIVDGAVGGPVNLAIGGSLRASAGATLDIAGAALAIGGDFDIAINNSARLDLTGAALEATGTALQRVEATSADVGAAGAPVLASLRIGAGATVGLADDHPNSGAPFEAIYTDALVVEPGATLLTNGVRIYYRSLSVGGVVSAIEDLVRTGGCAGDISADGVVDGADLGLLLGMWASAAPLGDLSGDGWVDGADLGLLLGAWGACD